MRKVLVPADALGPAILSVVQDFLIERCSGRHLMPSWRWSAGSSTESMTSSICRRWRPKVSGRPTHPGIDVGTSGGGEFAFIRRSGLVFGFFIRIGYRSRKVWALTHNPGSCRCSAIHRLVRRLGALRLIFPQEPEKYLRIHHRWQGLFSSIVFVPVSTAPHREVLTPDRLTTWHLRRRGHLRREGGGRGARGRVGSEIMIWNRYVDVDPA